MGLIANICSDRKLARFTLPLAVALIGGLALQNPSASYAQEEDLSTQQAEFDALMKSGEEQLNAKDFTAAQETFTKGIQLTGGQNAGPFLGRAKAFLGLKEYEASIEDLREALQWGSGNLPLVAEVQNTRGEVYIEQGAYDLALSDLQSAVEADRNNIVYQFNIGKVYTRLGGLAEAQKALTKFIGGAAEEDPRLAEAYRYRAEAYTGLARFDEAMADIAKSIELDPSKHEAHFAQAIINLQQKNYEPAAAAFQKAIETYKPEEGSTLPYIEAYLARATSLEELGKKLKDPAAKTKAFEAQRDTMLSLLELLPDQPQLAPTRSAALYRLGVAERLLGDLTDAVASFSEALELNSGLGEAYFRRGICFFYMGEEELAAGDFEQAAAINFDSPRANYWLGRCWARRGDFYEAVRAYSASIAVSDRYVEAYAGRGLANMRLGDYERALIDFNEAIRIRPSMGTNYYYRGIAQLSLGDRREAVQSLMSAIEFDEKLVAAYEPLARLLEAMGQGSLAAQYRSKAAALSTAASR